MGYTFSRFYIHFAGRKMVYQSVLTSGLNIVLEERYS